MKVPGIPQKIVRFGLTQLPTPAGEVIDYRNWQLPLGRRFRSVKVWFVLRSYGIEGFRNHLRKVSRLIVNDREAA